QFNSNFEGDAKSWSGTAEWQPVSNEWGISAPNSLGPYLTWELDPIARLLYTQRVNGSLDPIFAIRNDVLRIGPVLTLSVRPVENDVLVPHWLQGVVLAATYEWLDALFTHRTYRLLNTAVNFPLDPSGHFGVQLSYQRGQLEETGGQVNLITAGLS